MGHSRLCSWPPARDSVWRLWPGKSSARSCHAPPGGRRLQGRATRPGRGRCSEPSTRPLRTVPTDTHRDLQPVQALSSAGSPSAASLLPGSVCRRAEAGGGGGGHVGAQLCSCPAPQGKGWRLGPGLGSRGSALSLACVLSDSGFRASASPRCPAFSPAVPGAPGRTLTRLCLPAAHAGLRELLTRRGPRRSPRVGPCIRWVSGVVTHCQRGLAPCRVSSAEGNRACARAPHSRPGPWAGGPAPTSSSVFVGTLVVSREEFLLGLKARPSGPREAFIFYLFRMCV